MMRLQLKHWPLLRMSERSVKTYLKEVADFCEEQGMKLDRKPGKGIKPEFSEEQICAAAGDDRERPPHSDTKGKTKLYCLYSAQWMGYIHICAFFRRTECE